MEMHKSFNAGLAAFCIVALLGAVPAALAGPAENAIKACKIAFAEEQGSEMMARLKRIKSRGTTYEAWFNLSDGDDQLKAYCVAKRERVTEVFLAEGRWTSRKPSRPEATQPS